MPSEPPRGGSTRPPDFVAARDHVVATVVDFARTLRANGAAVPQNASLSVTRALAVVGLDDRDRVRAATHASLVTRPADDEVFDTHYPTFWYRLRSGLEATATDDDLGDRAGAGSPALFTRPDETASPDREDATPPPEDDTATDDAERDRLDADDVESRSVADRDDPDADAAADASADEVELSTYSAAGQGSVVDTAVVGAVEQAAFRRFERSLATLAGRRWSASGTDRVDGRRALRASVETGGVPLSLPERARSPAAFRCCVLVDVSRSVLDTVDESFLLAFCDSLVDAGRSVRVFFFDTDIREVTSYFERGRGDPGAALERAAVRWGGGTRIGASLTALRERWPDAVDYRTTTVVVSDGLDVGEIDVLEAELVWLARRSGPVVWLNPLAASASYEPTARGMAAALPYVDGLFAFAGPADLAEAARQLERHGARGPIGYRYDGRDRSEQRGNQDGSDRGTRGEATG